MISLPHLKDSVDIGLASSTEQGWRPGPGARGDASDIVAGRQFEAVFLQMLIKEMRQSAGGEGLFPGDASDSYGALFDQFLAEQMAAAGGVGLATLLMPPGDHVDQQVLMAPNAKVGSGGSHVL